MSTWVSAKQPVIFEVVIAIQPFVPKNESCSFVEIWLNNCLKPVSVEFSALYKFKSNAICVFFACILYMIQTAKFCVHLPTVSRICSPDGIRPPFGSKDNSWEALVFLIHWLRKFLTQNDLFAICMGLYSITSG